MPTVTVEFTHKGTTYTAEGSADFYGPYAECDGAEITDLSPETQDKDVKAEAEEAVRDAAYKAHKARHGAPQGDPNDDYDDRDSHTSGPDYWQDPESGEYRCG